jgi:hypothetical protein
VHPWAITSRMYAQGLLSANQEDLAAQARETLLREQPSGSPPPSVQGCRPDPSLMPAANGADYGRDSPNPIHEGE